MSAQIGNDMRMVLDSNNQQLLVENQCTRVVQKSMVGVRVTAYGRRFRLASQYGWIEVQRVAMPPEFHVPEMYIAARYLAGPCIAYSDEMAMQAYEEAVSAASAAATAKRKRRQ